MKYQSFCFEFAGAGRAGYAAHYIAGAQGAEFIVCYGCVSGSGEQISPIELAKRERSKRQRATSPKGVEHPKSDIQLQGNEQPQSDW